MLLFSQIIGRPVVDSNGTTLGRLKDLIASGGSYPIIKALVVEGPGRERAAVAWEQVESVDGKIRLNVTKRHIVMYETDPGDVFLAQQVLDRELEDLHGQRVGRVNDIQLAKPNSHYRVLAIDASARALLRRAGLDRAVGLLGIRRDDHLIPWDQLQLVRGRPPSVQITIPRSTIPRVHPSDLAEIVEQLSVRESSSLIEVMDDETAADTLEEVSERRQVQILKEIESEKAADILEEMGPNDAADVLGDLPATKAAELLSLMKEQESQEVRELLAYAEDTAGGIMTTEYISMPENLTVRQAMARLREAAREVENVYSVYVVDSPEGERLVGVISLRDLLASNQNRSLGEVADRSPIAVGPLDSQETVAKVIAKYNLLAVPVVDGQGRLQGIVSVDDAMDVLLPATWRKQLPRVFARVQPNGAMPVH